MFDVILPGYNFLESQLLAWQPHHDNKDDSRKLVHPLKNHHMLFVHVGFCTD